jgi:hypothetical protein
MSLGMQAQEEGSLIPGTGGFAALGDAGREEVSAGEVRMGPSPTGEIRFREVGGAYYPEGLIETIVRHGFDMTSWASAATSQKLQTVNNALAVGGFNQVGRANMLQLQQILERNVRAGR